VGPPDSPGDMLIPQKLALNSAIEDLVTIYRASEAEDWLNPNSEVEFGAPRSTH
jgi:hypothetical protein